MAKFDSKTFNPQAFGKYMEAVPNTRKDKLLSSGAIYSDSRLTDVFKNNTQTGTAYAVIPYYGVIGGDPINYDGETDITPQKTTTFEQGVFTYGRAQAWTEADFSYDITGGTDFMANVRAQITKYFNTVDQNALLAILKGIFAMTNAKGKAFAAKHTLDISAESEAVVGATTLNTLAQKACGDNKSIFSLAIMHSAIATGLENLKLLKYFTYTDENGVERDLSMGTWNGRLVIVDDSMPVESKTIGSANKDVYTTYVLGDGAIGLVDVGAKVPYEMDRNPAKNGGQDTLYVRRRNAVSVAGLSYKKASQATNSPTDAELAKPENWELMTDGTNVFDDKAIPIARIISQA